MSSDYIYVEIFIKKGRVQRNLSDDNSEYMKMTDKVPKSMIESSVQTLVKCIYHLDVIKNNITHCSECNAKTNKCHDMTVAMSPEIVVFCFIPCCMKKHCTNKCLEEINQYRNGMKQHSIVKYQCGGCGKINLQQKFRVCGKCKLAHYCSQECQMMDWSKHRLLCKK
jgi:hypothetical protein